MGDKRPIGVFDSGAGGLTVLQSLQRLLPDESTIYLGDLARCPYGPRPQPEVHEFAIQIGDFLAGEGIKLLVIACNTATSAAFQTLSERYPFPVVGVVEPGAREAVRVSRSGRIGVVATDGTVQSGAYRRSIARMRPDAEVTEVAASWLVPVIEAGVPDRAATENRLRFELARLKLDEIDTLILGCTHFPLVRDLFESALGSNVTIVDSADTTASEVGWLLQELDLHATGRPQHRLLITGAPGGFQARTRAMFDSSPEIETTELAPYVPLP